MLLCCCWLPSRSQHAQSETRLLSSVHPFCNLLSLSGEGIPEEGKKLDLESLTQNIKKLDR